MWIFFSVVNTTILHAPWITESTNTELGIWRADYKWIWECAEVPFTPLLSQGIESNNTLKRIIHHNQLGFIPGMQRLFRIHKSISVIFHMNKLREKIDDHLNGFRKGF